MSALVPLFLILVVAGTALWVFLPLRLDPGADPLASPDEVAELEARRQQLLASLQDLDFELQTGKLSADDHLALRDRLRAEAIDVLRRLDEARAQPDRRRAAPTRRPPTSPVATDAR